MKEKVKWQNVIGEAVLVGLVLFVVILALGGCKSVTSQGETLHCELATVCEVINERILRDEKD